VTAAAAAAVAADRIPGVRVYADGYLADRLAASPLRARLEQVAALPTVEPAGVEAFPDVVAKSWGFPSGLVVTTGGGDPFVYPMAVPDVACGYNVVATGLDARYWSPGELRGVYAAVVAAVAVDSPDRPPATGLRMEQVITDGVHALPPGSYAAAGWAAEQVTWSEPDPALLTRRTLATLGALTGSVTGHFIAIYTAAQILHPPSAEQEGLFDGEVVLVVHTGCPTVRAQSYQSHVLPMAEAALLGGHLPAEAVRAGLFGLPVSEPLAGEFLSLTAAGIHYGYANRHIVAERVLDVLDRHATPGQRQRPARLVRHVGHGAFETHHGGGRPARVVSRRGVQPLRWTGPAAGRPGHPLTFLTGGDSTHAYLVTAADGAASTRWRCGHGTPAWPAPGVPRHLFEQPHPPEFGLLLRQARAAVTNTAADPEQWWRAAVNLEAVAAYLETAGIARRVVRLAPLMNYKEHREDVSTPALDLT
jgi:tRNA-splicing ligase RtcB